MQEINATLYVTSSNMRLNSSNLQKQLQWQHKEKAHFVKRQVFDFPSLKKHPLGNDSDSLDDSNNGDADKDDIGGIDGNGGNGGTDGINNAGNSKVTNVDVDRFNSEKLFRLI